MHNLSVHDDLLVVLTSAVIKNYWKRRCYIDIWEGIICSYFFFYHTCSILNISLMIFYMSSYCIYPLNIKQIAIIGLMLSVTALSCQCGTNELSGFPIPFNWVSYVGFNFTEFTKVARLDACLFHMLKDSR